MKKTLVVTLLLLATSLFAADQTLDVVKDKSSIGFVGRKMVGEHACTFDGFDGSVKLTNNEPVAVNFRIELNSVKSEASPRFLKHLLSADFWDAAKHPTATFKSSRITKKSDSEYTVDGIFTLRGVANPISIPATVSNEEGGVRVKAEFEIDRQKWNVSYPGNADNLIKDAVSVTLDLLFPRS
jgi:polyisoprenoid-binding protein YceI